MSSPVFASINLENHRAFFSGPIDTEAHSKLADILEAANNQDTNAPVVLLFATEGGDVYCAMAMYDLIRTSRRPIEMVVNGPCLSAGTFIIQAAAKRFATPGSQFLVHFGSESSDSAAEQKHWRAIEKYWFDIFSRRTGVALRTVKRWHSGETFFNAQEAAKAGLIDEVVWNE